MTLSYKDIHVCTSLGKFCIVYLLLSQSFKPLITPFLKTFTFKVLRIS